MITLRKMRSNLVRTLQTQQRAVEREVKREFEELGAGWRLYYARVVSSWTNKPSFTVMVEEDEGVFRLFIIPRGAAADIWRYVDEGTGLYGPRGQAYKIRPKLPGGVLAFQPGYSARTAPVARFNVGTGMKSGDTVFRREVTHPGIQAREFGKAHAERVIERFPRDINESIARGIRRGTN